LAAELQKKRVKVNVKKIKPWLVLFFVEFYPSSCSFLTVKKEGKDSRPDLQESDSWGENERRRVVSEDVDAKKQFFRWNEIHLQIPSFLFFALHVTRQEWN